MNWFDVDKAGLAKLLERKGGKRFAIFELIQNCWDEDVKEVTVWLSAPRYGHSLLTVADDNPEGFKDITHAFTLFAESTKKNNPEKRGRFNLGEKLVIACCRGASITTTTGTVLFNETGRHRRKTQIALGSIFTGELRLTEGEYDDICSSIHLLIPPEGVVTSFNGYCLLHRFPAGHTEATLPTEVADTEGVLRRTLRKTNVTFYEVKSGETAHIYEMGIPVVETGDKYHVDVAQKVPLTLDRDNVPPSYLRALRTLALNYMYDRLETPEEATASWVRDAAGDKECSTMAAAKVATLRFGGKAVAYDLSDPEANNIAVSKGYTVVHGGTMSSGEWDNIRKAGTVLPAGQVTPSPKPFTEGGRPLKTLSMYEWTPGMKRVADFAIVLARKVMGVRLSVTIANDIKWPFGATYGKSKGMEGDLTINVGRVGHAFFNEYPGNMTRVLALLIHEFGHEMASNHLSEEYYEALCDLGAKMTVLALNKPETLKGE